MYVWHLSHIYGLVHMTSGFEAELDMNGSFEAGQQAVWAGDAISVEAPGTNSQTSPVSIKFTI